ncbi:MAG: hypothetical protein WBX18_14990, partial [Terracidiphilus sp.]
MKVRVKLQYLLRFLIRGAVRAGRNLNSGSTFFLKEKMSAPAACCVLLLLCAGLAPAEDRDGVRKPMGVYAHLDIETAQSRYPGSSPTTEQMHRYLRGIYSGLLADPAISGITAGMHWDHIQMDDPRCVFDHSCTASPDGYDWSYLDDVFMEANAAHKTVQLLITPGVQSPPWLLAKIPSCDGLFTSAKWAPADCGEATFANFPEEQERADGPVLPLPWNPVYIAAWDDFLVHLAARYNSNPALVYIAMGGPVCASTEIIFPTTTDGSTQLSGLPADKAWKRLIEQSFPYLRGRPITDQAFIDAWKQTIDAYEWIFSGITLVISPDAGNALPEFPGPVNVHPGNTLFAVDCSSSQTPMSCEAKTEILTYFVAAQGRNEKASEVGGMTAGSPPAPGDIGVAGLKVLTSLRPPPSPPILGGAEFDHAVSDPNSIQQQGCLEYPKEPKNCQDLTPEAAAYNTLTVFFGVTPAAGDYGGTTGPAPLQ